MEQKSDGAKSVRAKSNGATDGKSDGATERQSNVASERRSK